MTDLVIGLLLALAGLLFICWHGYRTDTILREIRERNAPVDGTAKAKS